VYFVLVTIYVVICFFLILVVLLQQGKGADIAGAFGGGSSQTAFGARGATTFLHKLTTGAFVGFVVISMLLSILEAKPKSSVISKSLPAAPKAAAPAAPGQAAPGAPAQAAPPAAQPAAPAAPASGNAPAPAGAPSKP
jgi:preprotein translocase subunit SecG